MNYGYESNRDLRETTARPTGGLEPPTPVERIPQVALRLGSVEAIINDLEKEIEKLTIRLRPVLFPTSNTQEVELKTPAQEELAPLAENLSRQYDRLRCIMGLLQDINFRIEL